MSVTGISMSVTTAFQRNQTLSTVVHVNRTLHTCIFCALKKKQNISEKLSQPSGPSSLLVQVAKHVKPKTARAHGPKRTGRITTGGFVDEIVEWLLIKPASSKMHHNLSTKLTSHRTNLTKLDWNMRQKGCYRLRVVLLLFFGLSNPPPHSLFPCNCVFSGAIPSSTTHSIFPGVQPFYTCCSHFFCLQQSNTHFSQTGTLCHSHSTERSKSLDYVIHISTLLLFSGQNDMGIKMSFSLGAKKTTNSIFSRAVPPSNIDVECFRIPPMLRTPSTFF